MLLLEQPGKQNQPRHLPNSVNCSLGRLAFFFLSLYYFLKCGGKFPQGILFYTVKPVQKSKFARREFHIEMEIGLFERLPCAGKFVFPAVTLTPLLAFSCSLSVLGWEQGLPEHKETDEDSAIVSDTINDVCRQIKQERMSFDSIFA